MKNIRKFIDYVLQQAPPGLQQDDQDFDDWVKLHENNCLNAVFFSWPRGRQAICTICVDLVSGKVFTRMGQATEPEQYEDFARKLENYLQE